MLTRTLFLFFESMSLLYRLNALSSGGTLVRNLRSKCVLVMGNARYSMLCTRKPDLGSDFPWIPFSLD